MAIMTEDERLDIANSTAIQNTLNALDKRGITEDFIALRLKQAMDAKLVKIFKGKDDDIIMSGELIDHATRLDALKFAATLRGMKPSEKHDINHHGDFEVFLREIDGESLKLPSQQVKNGD